MAAAVAAAPMDFLSLTKRVALAVKDRIKAHQGPIYAAAVAFFAFLAMIPALTGMITSYGIIADPEDITRQLGDALSSTPESTRTFLIDQMSSIAEGAGGALGFGLAISIILALFSASGAVANLIKALNASYELTETRKPWSLRGVALLLTVGGSLLLSFVIFMLSALPAVLDSVGASDAVSIAVGIARFPLLLGFVIFGLSALYRKGPDHKDLRSAPRKTVLIGAGVATLLFGLLSVAFSFYTANLGSYGETYGPLATIVVLLLWFQLSALAVIVGAEVDSVLRTELGGNGGSAEPTAYHEPFAR